MKKKNNVTNDYYLTDDEGVQQRVCRSFLLKCLRISQKRLSRAINLVTSNESRKEKRGTFPTKKTDQKDLQFLKEYINRFPAYESHYNSARTERKFLSHECQL